MAQEEEEYSGDEWSEDDVSNRESIEDGEESPVGDVEEDEEQENDAGGQSGDEVFEESDEEALGGERIDLEALSKDQHPCLAEGSFSIFNSPQVHPATVDDVMYNMDMDGFVVLSKYLSTFRLTKYGEARVWSTYPICDLQQKVGKSQMFDELPDELSRFKKWLPGFKLTHSLFQYGQVHVVFRPKSTADASAISELKEHSMRLRKVWWNSVLIPALRSLPPNTRTRRYNIVRTVQETDILPRYARLYEEDIADIDQALQASVVDDFEWFFICFGFGQRKLLEEDESLGPEAFGLGTLFDLSNIVKISLHLAVNLTCTDELYSLFWHRKRTYSWIQGTREKHTFPLFGLSELGNVTAIMPRPPALQAALGEECATYIQFYTPTVKAMEERVPLAGHPNLLTYLLGEAYVSTHTKFKCVWDEVRTFRTYFELLEAVHPSVPLDARMEMVVTAADTSFLESFGHRRLTRTILRDRLLIKVPAAHFSGYVRNLVKELYAPLQAAINGQLQGPGTTATVVLCESLLSFLPTGSHQFQPYKIFKAYNIMPMGSLNNTRRIDLRRYAITQNGILYITRPAMQRLFVPAFSMPSSARATAAAMLNFLDMLREAPRSRQALIRAATIILEQYQKDLHEMGIVRDPYLFQGKSSVCFRDAVTAEEYVSRVFAHPEQLPPEMSTRGFLHTALDLFTPSELHAKIVDALLNTVKVVPHTTVHARIVNFSTSMCSIIVRGSVSGRDISHEDAHRLVMASSQLIKENFVIGKSRLMQCQKFRPRLVQCVARAIRKSTSRTNGRLRHVLAVVAFATVVLADQENILARPPNYTRLRKKTNLYRYIKKAEMDEIVRNTDVEEEIPQRRRIPLRTFRVAIDRTIAPANP